MTVRILVADDHDLMRAGLRALLESRNDLQVVAEAGSGEQAYQQFRESNPDLVILDLSMPGIGGLGAARRILASEPKARCAILTGHDSVAYLKQSFEVGVLGYASKRINDDALINMVRVVMQGKKYIEPELAHRLAKGRADPLQTLSAREFEVFFLLSQGHGVQDVSRILSISDKTAGTHHTSIMKKLQADNLAQIAHIAIRNGILNPHDNTTVEVS